MKILKVQLIGFGFLALLVASNLVVAQTIEASYASTCAVCHGDKAQGVAAMNAPSLASQQSTYLERQLDHFASGLRGAHEKDTFGAQMRGFASILNAEQRKQMADYLSAIEAQAAAVKEVESIDGDNKKGKRYYQSYCGSCHGPNAEGNELLNSPKLVSLDGDYIRRQYQYFLEGVRGASKEDKYGRQMAMIAKGLEDPDALNKIIDYIHSLR